MQLTGDTLRWLRSAKDGDDESFVRLFELMAPSLLVWAELRIRPNQRLYIEPQDRVQEVWFRAWRSLDTFDEARTPFRLWVFRVAKNVLLEGFRQIQRADRGGAAGPSTKLFALQNLPDSATAVSSRLARDEGLMRFKERIDALAEDDRKLVYYCGLEGLPYREVAERMELSTDVVAKRWQRLRGRIAEAGLPFADLLADVASD
jgi:RNA polymerase sigma factor (sigma-70 family)